MGYGGNTSTGNSGFGNDGNMTVGDYANGVPNIRLSQIPASFARQIPWMIPLILIGVAACWYLTKDIKREYIADGSLWVTLGKEHTYDPTLGNKNSGLTITPDHVALSEVAIIKNQEILDQVTHDMIFDSEYGKNRFAPKLFDRYIAAHGQEQVERWNDILKMVDQSYAVMPKPKSLIVDLSFRHEDGAVAVETLNRFMTAYQTFRKSKFVNETSGQVSERRDATEAQLAALESKIQRILNENGISEFATEQDGAQKRAEELRAQLNAVRSRISAAEAALAVSEDQLRQLPPTHNLYVDDRLSQRLSQAKLERRQLLARYLPASSRVRQKDVEIQELEAQVSENGGKATGGRRVGPNKAYQDALTQRNKFQAEADSVREQEATIVAQLNSAVSKVRTMRELGPTYQSLLREKASLEERLKGLNAKEQEAIVNQQQQDSPSENIKELTRPTQARKGRNMKKIMFVLGSAGVMFTVFMLALLRVFLDPRLYRTGPSAQARQMPEPAPYQEPRYGVAEPIAPSGPQTPQYTPDRAPQPAYAPAAYTATPSASVGGETPAYGAQGPVFESTPYNATAQFSQYSASGDLYENPYPTPDYGHAPQFYDPPQAPQMDTAYEVPQAVHTPLAQPYTSSAGQSNDDVPILGSTDTNPYSGS